MTSTKKDTKWLLGDELYHYLLRTGALPVETVQKIFTQLVGAVTYIHTKSCVHRDLKLENVLLDKNENVKLCDFGFTREYDGNTNYLQTFCGTVCYSAPEMLKGEKYAGEKVDVWSLGVILYALLRGELPFDEDDEQATKAKILKEEPNYPENFPETAKALISRLLSKRPLHRPALTDILMDPFLAEHAPQQQAILKLTQPAPFTTALEKNTLERMKSAGVDIDQVIENVLSQRCDALSGWWSLLSEKEQRKEARRERKRKEREAELKVLRRLSGASGRLERIAPTLEEVDEGGEQRPVSKDRPRSGSRGRTPRRSTPQILVTDLPQLPEGSAIQSPSIATPPPPPVDKDSIRSPSISRPPPPPKERRRRSSTLQLVTNNSELLGPTNGVNKRRFPKRSNIQFLKQLTALKHWFVESTKLTKSPGKSPQSGKGAGSPNNHVDTTPTRPAHNREISGHSALTRSSFGAALTPTSSRVIPSSLNGHVSRTRDPRTDASQTKPHRNSLSPSPITPRSSYRRTSGGLRGRKSTSSSISSVRSMPRHTTHSKTSSVSSNSIDNIHSPGSRSVGRSPHPSIKVLPVTPTVTQFPSNVRLVRNPPSFEGAPYIHQGSVGESDGKSPFISHPVTGVMFARRKKSAFKGLSINSGFFGSSIGHIGPGLGSPLIRPREGSDGKVNLGLRDAMRRGSAGGKGGKRKSQIIEEEEEDEDGLAEGEDGEEIEEVDAFTPVDLARGESVQSITVWDDPPSAGGILSEKMSDGDVGVGVGGGGKDVGSDMLGIRMKELGLAGG